jgi:hypothetical protein
MAPQNPNFSLAAADPLDAKGGSLRKQDQEQHNDKGIEANG